MNSTASEHASRLAAASRVAPERTVSTENAKSLRAPEYNAPTAKSANPPPASASPTFADVQWLEHQIDSNLHFFAIANKHAART